MKNLGLKKSSSVKASIKKPVSNADILTQILAVPFDEKFAAEMRALQGDELKPNVLDVFV